MTVKENADRLHKKAGTFIISCVDGNGYPYTKAVVPAKVRESIDEIYFCTNTSSDFSSHITSSPKASVYFYSKKFVWKGCLLTGEMEIVEDISLKAKFWQNKFKNAYKEKSYTDPDFCLLRFKYKTGRFYSWYKPENF